MAINGQKCLAKVNKVSCKNSFLKKIPDLIKKWKEMMIV